MGTQSKVLQVKSKTLCKNDELDGEDARPFVLEH